MSDTIDKKENGVVDKAVHYVAKANGDWGIPMTGLEADNGSGLDYAGVIGIPMVNLKVEGKLVKKARVKNKRGKWLKYGSGFDTELGDDTDITGIEIVGKGLVVAAHIRGGQWLNPVFTSDDDGVSVISTGAVIDAIWIDEI